MDQSISVGIIDNIKDLVYDVATSYAKKLKSTYYADIRVEVGEAQAAVAENGSERYSAQDYSFSFGVRVLAGKKAIAPGYFGQVLGSADLDNISEIIKNGVRHAYQRALANAKRKAQAKKIYGALAEGLHNAQLAHIEVHQDVVSADYEIDPRSVRLSDLAQYVKEVSKAMTSLSNEVKHTFTSGITGVSRHLFCSSEGANIDQSFALTQGMAFLVAQSDKGNQELYDFIGHQRGWEVLERGVDEEYIRNPDFMTFSLNLAKDAIELANAEPLKSTSKDVVVVTDPHFNTLVAHEIVGHPTELDRAIKMEAGYAGRSWLLKDLKQTQIGKQIASPLVSAFSDPALPGYGHYKYDDEGTPAKKVVLIEKGIFRGFMNSRQTAAIFGVKPNGSYKASDASLVPLIRMSTTVFAPGQRDPQEIIKEVDHGYYVVGHRIPSISESRENFRISAMKVYEIRNGQIGQLFRNGGITSDSRDYFMNVDAVGNDFRLYPIPNCGKGQPMQAKRLGNGGPTMRSRAKLAGV